MAKSGIAIDLSADGKEGLPLRDGVELEGVARDTDRQHGPERDPGVPFGAERGQEGVIVPSSHGRRGRLDVGTRGAHAGSKGAHMAP